MTPRALRLAALVAALALAPGASGRAQDAVTAGVAEARELFRQGKYEAAAKRFRQYENELKYPVAVSQECIFSEGECYRLLKEYPRAVEAYELLLKRFAETLYREEVLQHLYEIACYWLEDTRAEMREAKGHEGQKGVTLRVHLAARRDKSKPAFGQERWALHLLGEVRAADPHGPLAERCLFTEAAVRFFRAEYGAAGHRFEEVADHHPGGALAYPALKYAILARCQARGALDRAAEVRKLVERARADFPAQVADDAEFFAQQLKAAEGPAKAK